MESNFHSLPPLKRFKLMHQEQQSNASPKAANSYEGITSQSCLPAKKRKGCLDSPSFFPISPPSYSYCFPAKKKIWALPPFDLNLEWGHSFDPNFEKPHEISGSDEKDSVGFEESLDRDAEETIVTTGDDDGISCAVCGSMDGDPTDPIVLCDGCDLMVHSTCYGYPLTNGIPEGDWFCAQCLETKSVNIEQRLSCCLCPNSGGALKPTTDGRWAHLLCSIYVPEVFFLDPENREGIDCGKVAKRRWKQKCYICESYKGCVVDCSEPKCQLAFHVSCGMKEELCMEFRQGKKRGAVVAAFCRSHTDLWKKQEKTGKFKIVARDECKE